MQEHDPSTSKQNHGSKIHIYKHELGTSLKKCLTHKMQNRFSRILKKKDLSQMSKLKPVYDPSPVD